VSSTSLKTVDRRIDCDIGDISDQGRRSQLSDGLHLNSRYQRLDSWHINV
jgi:hypothetical protein